MPTPLFRLNLTRHPYGPSLRSGFRPSLRSSDPVLQLARARPDRVQLVAWAVRYLAENTNGLDVIIVERPGTLRPVEVLGAAWLDAVRRAMGRGERQAARSSPVVDPASDQRGGRGGHSTQRPPVYADLGGQLLVQEDLSVLVVPDDGEPEDAAVQDVVLAHTVASERFPTLETLRPVVDASDPMCDLCDGRGRVGPVRCGRCYGLGRIPKALQGT